MKISYLTGQETDYVLKIQKAGCSVWAMYACFVNAGELEVDGSNVLCISCLDMFVCFSRLFLCYRSVFYARF